MKPAALIGSIILLTYLLVSCDSEQRRSSSNSAVMKVSLNYLVSNYKSLQGQRIETEGIVYWEFENVAICTKRKLFSNERNCFWLDFNRSLQIDDSVMQWASGETFTLRGIIDTSSKGHLGYYLATLKDINFLEQK